MLTANELARRFAGRNSPVKAAVGTLYELLIAPHGAEISAAFNAWLGLYAQIGGPDLVARRNKLAKLAASFELSATDFRPAELLFALHAYYALIVKLVAKSTLARSASEGSIFQRDVAGDPFAWLLDSHEPRLIGVVQGMQTRLDEVQIAPADASPGVEDLFQPLYEALFPKQVRHALGEYYTPAWLAEHVLDQLGYDGDPRVRLLDPACGSGVFLLAALRRVWVWQARHGADTEMSGEEVARLAATNIVGCDLNPLAVLAARVNLARGGSCQLPDLRGGSCQLPSPSSDHRKQLAEAGSFRHGIHQCDSILSPPDLGQFDIVAGNPPWVAWDNLPEEYRAATKPFWEQYGLFSLGGTAARHGGGKKDLSMLMLYAAADRHLATGGRLGFVLTQTLLQTGGAGDGFRRFRLGESGSWLSVLRVDDLVAARPFAAANWTCALFLEKGRPTNYPVPYYRWPAKRASRKDASLLAPSTEQAELCHARPIDTSRSNSPWLVESVDSAGIAPHVSGPSDYQAHLGVNTGGANGVFWVRILARSGNLVEVENLVELGKQPVPRVRQWLERDLLYPLARWSDVTRHRVCPSAYLLLAQDPTTRAGIDEQRLRGEFPLTFAYLAQFEPLLRRRAAFQRYQGRAAFYSMYDVGTYSLAPHKVVWRRMDRQISAAVTGEIDDPFLGQRPIIPQETCVLVACETEREAHYLCGLLNSPEVGRVVEAHSVRGGKGFGTPGMLAYLNLRRYDPANPRHQELAEESAAAHLLALV